MRRKYPQCRSRGGRSRPHRKPQNQLRRRCRSTRCGVPQTRASDARGTDVLMEGVLTAKSEEKKQASKPASDSFSESAPRPAALGASAHANASMGALAYTAGDRIGCRREPDVKLAAHEAAHVVQQRSGAKLAGGVGRPGDAYERQADAVADAVDRGESAEPILDRTISSNPSGSEPVVQHALAINAFHLTEPPIAMTRPT